MKLKVKKKKVSLKEAPQTYGRNQGNRKFRELNDEYEPEVVSEHEILVKEYKSTKGGNVKVFLKFKVQRFDKNDGEGLGLPYVFAQMYQKSEKDEGYTGYLKGKSVHFPLEMLYDVIDTLTELSDTCDKLKIE